MIKRMIGVVAALAVAAVIVWTVMHRDAYRSMCFDASEPATAAAGPVRASADSASAASDAAVGEGDPGQRADSLTEN